MISYYDLLGMIKEGKEPKEIVLQLNCGTRTYIPEYDGGEFFLYKLKNMDLENEDFHYYLSDTLLESQMLEKCITVINGKEDLKKEMSKLQSEIDLLSNEVQKEYSKVISNRDRINYMKEQLKELMRMVNNEN